MTTGEYKRCPDCAEMVLAQARKCRYCGYRFDHAREPATGLQGFLDTLLRRRSVESASLEEMLERWGFELEPSEEVAYFGYCALDSSSGFLLVTSARVAFFAGRSQQRLLDWQLDAVRAVESRGGRGRGGLVVTGPDRRVTLAQFASRAAQVEIADRLRRGS